MKLKKLILLAVAMMASVASGAVIKVSSTPSGGTGARDRLITSPSGVRLASGFAGSGTFNISDTQVATLIASGSYTQLFAAFTPSIGTDNFVTGYMNLYGSDAPVAGAFAFNNPAVNAGDYIGKTIYTFVGNSATLSASTALALFKHNTVVVADPTNPPVNTYSLGLSGTDGQLLIGSPGSNTSLSVPEIGVNNPSIGTIQLVLIPEPSAALLGMLGALGLLRRRR